MSKTVWRTAGGTEMSEDVPKEGWVRLVRHPKTLEELPFFCLDIPIAELRELAAVLPAPDEEGDAQ